MRDGVCTTSPCEETFREVEKLIHHTVHRFVRRFGGDYEELESEAHVAFMKAYRAHDFSRGSFTTLLVTAVWRRLISYSQQTARKAAAVQFSAMAREPDQPARKDHGDLDLEFTEHLSSDARALIGEVVRIVHGDRKNGRVPTATAALADAGWKEKRRVRALNEVRAILGARDCLSFAALENGLRDAADAFTSEVLGVVDGT